MAAEPIDDTGRLAPDDPERGSISSWLVTGAFVLILGVGIAVDLTGQVHTQQRTHGVAVQAARAGGQQLEYAQVMRGLSPQADPYQAAAAARSYLASAGVTGDVSVRGGNTVVVEARDVYETKFLSIIGLSTLPVTGEGEARMVRAVEGVEE
jgi:hypothetical protein